MKITRKIGKKRNNETPEKKKNEHEKYSNLQIYQWLICETTKKNSDPETLFTTLMKLDLVKQLVYNKNLQYGKIPETDEIELKKIGKKFFYL